MFSFNLFWLSIGVYNCNFMTDDWIRHWFWSRLPSIVCKQGRKRLLENDREKRERRRERERKVEGEI